MNIFKFYYAVAAVLCCTSCMLCAVARQQSKVVCECVFVYV